MSAFSNNIFDLLNEDGDIPKPVAPPKEQKKAEEPKTEKRNTKANGAGNYLLSTFNKSPFFSVIATTYYGREMSLEHVYLFQGLTLKGLSSIRSTLATIQVSVC